MFCTLSPSAAQRGNWHDVQTTELLEAGYLFQSATAVLQKILQLKSVKELGLMPVY